MRPRLMHLEPSNRLRPPHAVASMRACRDASGRVVCRQMTRASVIHTTPPIQIAMSTMLPCFTWIVYQTVHTFLGHNFGTTQTIDSA